MNKKEAKQLITLLQEVHTKKKKKVNFLIKGEDAILMYLLKGNVDKTVTPTEISESLKISTARVAASLNGLESKGLLTREIDPNDRRKIIIDLTKKGIIQAEELAESHLNNISRILSLLGEEDTQALIKIVTKFKDLLSEDEILC